MKLALALNDVLIIMYMYNPSGKPLSTCLYFVSLSKIMVSYYVHILCKIHCSTNLIGQYEILIVCCLLGGDMVLLGPL